MDDHKEREARLDLELELVRKLRVALTATLYMFESVRDDVTEMGERMDRLRLASERCRKALMEEETRKKKNEEAT